MSDSVRPHRQQPTRLPCPWDSPGKNTGVGCHFLLQCRKVKSESEVAQSCPTLSDSMDCSPPGSSVHGIFLGKSTGVGANYLHSVVQSSPLSNFRAFFLSPCFLIPSSLHFMATSNLLSVSMDLSVLDILFK